MVDATDVETWMGLSYGITCTCLFLFAVYAVVYSAVYAPKNASSLEALATLKGFVAIRSTQGMWRIAWSMFAGSMGAWCITAPADYASFAGWLGGMMYALATGLPLIFIAFFGQMIKDKYPRACSVGDYVALRFGPAARFLVTLVALFNMLIFMLAEFTTIGSLFADFVGSVNYPIIIVVAVLTTAYTAYGGVLVSIVTDQVQALVSMLLLAIATIYVIATFKEVLPVGFGDNKPLLAPNEAGYASIFTMPISLLSATVFNEAMWQRVWAAESPKALYGASFIAAFFVSAAVCLYAMSGFLVTWAQLADENTNPNLLLFQVFKSSGEDSPATVSSWISLLVLVLAAIMNQSAIDSLLSGITGTIATYFLPGKPVGYARILTALITIPVCILSLWNGRVLSIFLTANMVGTCTFLPIVIGGFLDSDSWKGTLSETPYVLSCIFAALATTGYGIGRFWDPTDVAASFQMGASYAWYEHWYEWDYFMVALASSFVSFFAFGAINALFVNHGIYTRGISDFIGCTECTKNFGVNFVDEGTQSSVDGESDATPKAVETVEPTMTYAMTGYPQQTAYPQQEVQMVPIMAPVYDPYMPAYNNPYGGNTYGGSPMYVQDMGPPIIYDNAYPGGHASAYTMQPQQQQYAPEVQLVYPQYQ